MPELPEVETVRVQLWGKIVGKSVSKAEVLHSKTVRNETSFARKLKGKKFVDIDRVGKLLIFKFENELDIFLLAHLKMTGQFFFVDSKGRLTGGGGHTMTAGDLRELPGKHTRVSIRLDDGSTLFFNDMRLFGYLRLVSKVELEATQARFGQEPISDSFDAKRFQAVLKKRKGPIKAILLDQTLIAGLGNIYVDEALFQSDIRPDRPANSLTGKEMDRLIKAAGKVMKEAIKNGGTTFQNFADTAGAAGGHTKHLKVFARHGQPCPKCGELILKTRVAGRGTHYCEHCQK